MPLVSLHSAQATQTRKQNRFAGWGSRNEENRVEPIAEPAFKVPFYLEQGEPIFTIGSCFARNVESELLNRGFRIPIRELLESPEFESLPPEIINNFGTPSIFNEFAWAFGRKHYEEDANIVEVGENKFVDLHMVNSIRPCPRDVVIKRRRGLIEATRTLSECRVLIITLGLVELWWDAETQDYLNTTPLPSVLKRWPKRFRLDVLNFDECYTFLHEALDIAFENGPEDLKVILTVSPVPMMATHRNVDVITANSYSKSVLRTVAEQLVSEHDRITYFPSFETVTLSDRRVSWTDDFVHVSRDMIALNVERMVNAYTNRSTETQAVLPQLDTEAAESADAILLTERARLARLSDDREFFDANADHAETSPSFALEYIRFLLQSRRYDEILDRTTDPKVAEATKIRALAFIGKGNPESALETIRPLCLSGLKGHEHWRIYVQSAVQLQSEDAIRTAEQEWLATRPRDRGTVLSVTGRAFQRIRKHKLAIKRLNRAVKFPESTDTTVIDYATSLIALRDHEAAKEVLEGLTGSTEWQIKQIRKLKDQIEKSQ